MNNKSKYKIFIYIIIALLATFFLKYFLEYALGIEIQGYLSLAILFIIISLLCPLVVIIYKLIQYLFKNKKYFIAVISLLFIIFGAIFILGGIIFFQGTPFSGEYEVDTVKVVDSSWNRVQIDYTKYNHDDYKVITIKKPIFIKVKSGDMIDVRYPINNPNKMIYVINAETGLMMIGISLGTLKLLMIITCSAIIIYVLKKKNGRKK